MLTISLIFLLLSNAVTYRQDKAILFSRIVTTGLVYCSYLALNNLYIQPLGKGIGIYGGLFNITTFTQTFNIFLFLVSAIILTLTSFFPRKVYVENYSSLSNLFIYNFTYNKNLISNSRSEQFRIIEYPLIILFILCGAVFLITTGDLISVFISIELQSYGLYILSSIYRDSESATASGLTYFLLGGLSSCFILLGSALIYANTGTTNLDNIYIIASISEITDVNMVMFWYQPYYLHMSLIIMSVGFLFKVSAAPFHFWSPDVYDGIPTIVTTYVAIIAKISIFAFFLELVYFTEHSILNFSWKNVLLLSSLFSLIVGSVLGLTQSRIKRLFAYSTISHVGFILLALSINSAESIQSYIFYILQYSLSNLNAFIILVSMGYTFYLYVYKEKTSQEDFIDKNNSPVQLISQIKGYFDINPYISISLAITLFSFVGVPPMVGFFAKQMILSAALDSGYIFMSLIAIITSVIGAGYYLNLVKQIFFFKNDYKINPSTDNLELVGHILPTGWIRKAQKTQNMPVRFKPENITINSSLTTNISVLTLLLVLFIFVPGEWFNIVGILSVILFKG